MSEQLALLEPPEPKLTDRQQFALELVKGAGVDGIHADEVGAAWCARRDKHPASSRCRWCGSNGKDVLEELKRKDLVRYVRGRGPVVGFWRVVGAAEPRPARGMLGDEEPIPF